MTSPILKNLKPVTPPDHEAEAKAKELLDTQLAKLTRNASDLQHKTFAPMRWIVPDIWPEGLSMLVGKPKVGKSYMALDVAIAVASGGMCLGKQCEQGDVLALFLEDNDRRIQSRMTDMLGANKDAWPSRLTYATEWPRFPDGVDLIRRWVESVEKPRLVIVDILERVRKRVKNANATQYSADYDALTMLHGVAIANNISTTVLHHQRKMASDDPMDTVSGTGGLSGSLDTLLVLGKDAASHFLYGRGRDVAEFSIAVSQDERTKRWDNLGVKPEVQVSAERTLIVAALARVGRPMSVKEIAKAVPSMKEVNVKNLLPFMQRDGDIETVARGMYRLPNPQMQLGAEEHL